MKSSNFPLKLFFFCLLPAAVLILGWGVPRAWACTGLSLKSGDGAVVYGRSMEWGSFDLKSRVTIVPRDHGFTGTTPDGKPGLAWKAKYGMVGLDMMEKNSIADGINEKGLVVGAFYHPGFAVYQDYDPAQAAGSMGPADLPTYILTNFSTAAEVREAMPKIRVVPVAEEFLGAAPPMHWMVLDAGGDCLVIEYLKGRLTLYDNPLGVITNAPTFDWHITNLRNYVNLSPVALPDRKLADLDFSPLGAGSGMIGLPGDFTPPSRFIRAVAWTRTARPTVDGGEAIYEIFRIMDNFNLPLHSAEGSDLKAEKDPEMRSSTIWTCASDTKNLRFYFHTQHNRRVRMVDVKAVNFAPADGKIVHLPMDKEKKEDILDITPRP